MKRKLILGSILPVFILVMLPSIPAVNYNTAKQMNEKSLDEIQEQIHQIIEQYQDENGIGTIFFLILKWIGAVLHLLYDIKILPFGILPMIYMVFMYIYLLITWS